MYLFIYSSIDLCTFVFYILTLMYKLKNTLAGHKRSVTRAKFSNSGKYLASAS